MKIYRSYREENASLFFLLLLRLSTCDSLILWMHIIIAAKKLFWSYRFQQNNSKNWNDAWENDYGSVGQKLFPIWLHISWASVLASCALNPKPNKMDRLLRTMAKGVGLVGWAGLNFGHGRNLMNIGSSLDFLLLNTFSCKLYSSNNYFFGV